MVLFLMNECLFIKSVIFQQITQLRLQREKFATFYRNFHFLRQFHRNKLLKTQQLSSKKLPRNHDFRPQLSQKCFPSPPQSCKPRGNTDIYYNVIDYLI